MAAFLKRLGGTIAVLMLTQNLNAQVAHPMPHTNASWGQVFGMWDAGIFETYSFGISAIGDTIVNGTSYIQTYSYGGPIQLIRQDSSGKVWIRDTTDKLLYDFNAAVGDTVNVYVKNGPLGSGYSLVEIDSIGTYVLNNGEIRKCLYPSSLSSIGISGGGYMNWDVLVWIEGIGSNAGLFLPNGVILDDNLWLECFVKNDTLLYGDSCTFYSGITSLTGNQQVSIYPNPSKGNFTIQLPKRLNGTFNLSIQNTIGQIVYQNNVEPKNGLVEVNLSSVSNGLYIVTLRNGNGVYNAKLLIEKQP